MLTYIRVYCLKWAAETALKRAEIWLSASQRVRPKNSITAADYHREGMRHSDRAKAYIDKADLLLYEKNFS